MSSHKFTRQEISDHVDKFFSFQPNTEARIVIAVEEAYQDPIFKEDIAQGMADVMALLHQFEIYMEAISGK